MSRETAVIFDCRAAHMKALELLREALQAWERGELLAGGYSSGKPPAAAGAAPEASAPAAAGSRHPSDAEEANANADTAAAAKSLATDSGVAAASKHEGVTKLLAAANGPELAPQSDVLAQIVTKTSVLAKDTEAANASQSSLTLPTSVSDREYRDGYTSEAAAASTAASRKAASLVQGACLSGLNRVSAALLAGVAGDNASLLSLAAALSDKAVVAHRPVDADALHLGASALAGSANATAAATQLAAGTDRPVIRGAARVRARRGGGWRWRGQPWLQRSVWRVYADNSRWRRRSGRTSLCRSRQCARPQYWGLYSHRWHFVSHSRGRYQPAPAVCNTYIFSFSSGILHSCRHR